MAEQTYGKILLGSERDVARSYEKWSSQPVDQEWVEDPMGAYSERQTTIGKTASVTGPGTFFGQAERQLTFEPTDEHGWWFDRSDLPGSLPIRVTGNNIWTTVRNIVLSSGSPHNYMRMVEHIIALRVGMGLDNVIIRLDSGDPPLFDRSSMDLVEAVEEAGIVESEKPPVYVTVKRPITVAGRNGSFLTFLPNQRGERKLTVDCAVDFSCAIGRQRIKFQVTPASFRHGALARTNCTLGMMMYFRTIGQLFADTRNLGYTKQNILVAGPRRYYNEPHLIHEGRSLEVVWHRATLDLLAAVALIDRGRFCGHIISYKAGHALDCLMVSEIYKRHLLQPT